jgi:antibiotic biosynthesis monooxygenase (ABM) superfamily enzyme
MVKVWYLVAIVAVLYFFILYVATGISPNPLKWPRPVQIILGFNVILSALLFYLIIPQPPKKP